MKVNANNVAVQSTPHFELVLQDHDAIYYPKCVLYKVQAQQEKTLDWVDVGTTQCITPSSMVADIYLTPEQTALIEGTTLLRRLIVELHYTEAGQTAVDTQVIDFTLNNLPVLSDDYEEGGSATEPEVEVQHVAGSSLQPSCTTRVELTNPVNSVTHAYWSLTGEPDSYQECSRVQLLSGNSIISLEYEPAQAIPPGVLVYLKIEATSLITMNPLELEASYPSDGFDPGSYTLIQPVKVLDCVENGEYSVLPDTGYQGMRETRVNVEVPAVTFAPHLTLLNKNCYLDFFPSEENVVGELMVPSGATTPINFLQDTSGKKYTGVVLTNLKQFTVNLLIGDKQYYFSADFTSLHTEGVYYPLNEV